MHSMDDLDIYELLEIDETASKKAIDKAYRKAALKNHPDKNPTDPTAKERFLLIKSALKILTDEKLKTEYDRKRLQKRKHEAERRKYDIKRRKFLDDLERRESEAFLEKNNDTLLAEISRLQKENSLLVEQEKRRCNEANRKLFDSVNLQSCNSNNGYEDIDLDEYEKFVFGKFRSDKAT